MIKTYRCTRHNKTITVDTEMRHVDHSLQPLQQNRRGSPVGWCYLIRNAGVAVDQPEQLLGDHGVINAETGRPSCNIVEVGE